MKLVFTIEKQDLSGIEVQLDIVDRGNPLTFEELYKSINMCYLEVDKQLPEVEETEEEE